LREGGRVGRVGEKRAGVGEERAFGFACALDLPEGVAAMADTGDVVECSDVGEEGDFFFVEGGDAEGQVVDGGEGAVVFAGGDDGFAYLLAEASGVAEAEAQSQERGAGSREGVRLQVTGCRLREIGCRAVLRA
jgi:hypothetical protein